ncbi:MAG TPA: biotin-dependent carboxyltransferase family protein [Xanthomonadaceae bacterium]|nr:biotin-dependent carboxyltransferase family protein [Xanthomonadaceae bacterium]
MNVRVLAPGLLTTVQDRGRLGWRHLGVGAAGALDPHAHALANLLAGNDAGAATLEISLAGPTLRFERAARIALCGADIEARCDGIALPGARPCLLPAGSTLALGPCRRGARAYLAVEGGFDVGPVLGSRSTDLRGGFGGLDGRALRKGDALPLGPARDVAVDAPRFPSWWIDAMPGRGPAGMIRVLPGADATAPGDALFRRDWDVAAASDRQGLRLEGEAIAVADRRERVSAPVAPGTIQLPPDGRPIVLLADAQTHGGYPRIGHVVRADWPRLAQLRPGERLRFAPCTPEQAHAAWQRRRQELARLALMIAAAPL